jgi:hypothetical protein
MGFPQLEGFLTKKFSLFLYPFGVLRWASPAFYNELPLRPVMGFPLVLRWASPAFCNEPRPAMGFSLVP